MNPPDKRKDDILFGDLFLGHGWRDTLARLMGVDNSQVTLQLDADSRVRSYYHCGKLALYAADMADAQDGGARGDVLWNDLADARAGWLGARKRPVKVKFPSRLAHEVIDLELNGDELDKIPATRRLELVRKLIRDLESYAAGLMRDDVEDAEPDYRGGEGHERVRRETDTPEPQPSAASVTTAGRRAP